VNQIRHEAQVAKFVAKLIILVGAVVITAAVLR
jgi:hypothetical protein